MQGFALIPEPSESKRVRFISSRGFSQDSFKQMQSVFLNNLAKLSRDLRSVLEDIQITLAKPPQQIEFQNKRQIIKGCQDKFVRQMLLRNGQPKKTIDDYHAVFKEKFQDPEQQDTTTIERTSRSRNLQSANQKQIISFDRYNSCRPRTTPINHRFSRSLVIERRSKESILNTPQGGRFAMVFQSRTFTPHGKGLRILDSSKFAERQPGSTQPPQQPPALSFCSPPPEQSCRFPCSSNPPTPSPVPLLPTQPLYLSLQQHSPPRISFIDQNRQHFAPAFGQRRSSAVSAHTSQSVSKSGELQILKEKIKLLNCEWIIKVNKQQGYRRKARNPRNFSSIFS